MDFPRKMTIIDTNVVLRYLLRDHEEFYKEAEALFDRAFSGKKKLFLLDTVIAEVVYVLSGLYKVKRQEIAQVLKELLKAKGINAVDKEVLFDALETFAKKNLDFVDCLICAYATKYQVISFDKKVQKCADETSKK
ncbi:MAG TPA: PIN domain-containing protein [Thermodesulfatator atlanticus]|uniref:PIN domain-containing protein n=1 Tax=Thermodesulfatator atlanticus TaxID=501497 RepID=A0A7V5NYW0_9BACT|nr:PIN domain-containing protein [Thermodesulfatator atlanticus]